MPPKFSKNGGIVNFFSLPRFVTSGDTGDVVMAVPLVVFFDVGDEVALHDLHVVDVVEQLKAGTGQFACQGNAPTDAICHVIGVVHKAVEELHLQYHTVLFGERHQGTQGLCGLLQSLFFAQAAAVAGGYTSDLSFLKFV